MGRTHGKILKAKNHEAKKGEEGGEEGERGIFLFVNGLGRGEGNKREEEKNMVK